MSASKICVLLSTLCLFSFLPSPVLALDCSAYQTTKVGSITNTDPRLNEISGLVASHKQPGVFWGHNDSGDMRNVYALDENGAYLGTYQVLYNGSASSQDMEDIAFGPGPDPNQDYLFLGDIGDNARTRADARVYRIPEPTVNLTVQRTHPVSVTIPQSDRFIFHYPDHPNNAESLIVDHRNKDIYIISKGSPTRMYRAPYPDYESQTITLQRYHDTGLLSSTGSLISTATGADLSWDGRLLLVRNYHQMFAWELPAAGLASSTPLAELVSEKATCERNTVTEHQGEAVALDRTAPYDFYTTTEGLPAPITKYTYVPIVPMCSLDTNGNDILDVPDLIHILTIWGPCSAATCQYDINADNIIGLDELLEVITKWGSC